MPLCMSERVSIAVNGQRLEADVGTKLLGAIMQNNIPIETACGGKGACHLCRVTITQGKEALPAPNATEKRALGNGLIAQGMRLACQILLQCSIEVVVPVPRPRRQGNLPQRRNQ